ncbi:malto-oligosyltrehalose synthase [Arthrobacter sp. zg-Y820]|uniref:malto-oligosyltrehalose synthase n=1 Tax=unclassified Arthrobacter TaxID=235627 RepID=UPI001E317A80|nr:MULTISPECIES: malto-oligosyltrehalose synthase [unclassified Arthrobacter]MCC9195832.1 malto-oligosyltrehalose synthase [Arthrobacter sp. zg-Y820]MDK1278692.1 malto-oligosyltrehalose synthase [Arthrobacter sp. zg.Y820]WIB08879.1 malto-oligosyltrehalose synthase [Arthrobacter sp. zg-Y820]
MRTPLSTYRLQIRPSFTLFDAADLVPYLADLGVDWVYLSPILTAEEGSDHGYDVTDPSAVDPARGGPEGLKALSDAAHAAGLGVLVDIVPNHMGIATPHRNPWWWSVLKEGRGSRYAEAFDIDWDAANGKLRLPVLGDGPNELAELKLADGELHYYDHRFPVAEGTAAEGDSAQDVHARQSYELVNWRRADNELNYRRFFGVNTLAGLRVEEPWVFDESHAEIRRWFDEGLVDGLRIDHPDGLADPKGYLTRLREITRGAYILVEKILEPGEKLAADWETEGTTGYDALADIDRLFVDPAGNDKLTALVPMEPYAQMIHGTKRVIADNLLHSEVQRLVRLLPADSGLDPETAADALAELLACFPVYRSYLPEGAGYLTDALIAAKVHRPDLAAALDILHSLLNPLADADSAEAVSLSRLGELAVRFQQTSGMVMAKGVEDTAFYRYSRLTSLNEVGADPAHFSVAPGEMHARLIRRQLEQPAAMTALTTHDTKRSEDTRARISVLAEIPDEWREAFTRLDALAPMNDAPMANLLWQTFVGAWPLSRERAHAYAEKASREASSSTTWTAPNAEFEERMHAAIDAAFDDPGVNSVITALVERIREAGYSNSLSAKLLQLTMPGVPDVYQGTEFWDRSLVDPDNRRQVDFARRREVAAAFAAADAGAPALDEDAAAKLLVTTRALQLKHGRPELFTGYVPVAAEGPAAEYLFGFDRGGAVTLVTRLPLGLQRSGGWQDTAVVLAAGTYRDVISGKTHESGGRLAAADLFGTYPVALLVREDGE